MSEKIIIADFSDGEERLKVKGLWQYDYGAKLEVRGLTYSNVVQVDFAPINSKKTTPVVTVAKEDGSFTATIPKSLLEQPFHLNAYIYLSEEEYGSTTKSVLLLLSQRQERGTEIEGDTESGENPFQDAIDQMQEYATQTTAAAKEAKEAVSNLPLIDETLTLSGKAADAKVVGEKLSKLADELGTGTGSGVTAEVKTALMALVEHIGTWTDANGQTYIDNLRTALYNAPLKSITVVYNQSKSVYPTDALEVLRDDLTVTGIYTDGTSAVVTAYTLSGTLTTGTATITVTYNGKTATSVTTVEAVRVPATGITLDQSTLKITSTDAAQLTATVTPDNTTDSVVWKSSDTTVATVDNGNVTPIASGSCTITATVGDYSAECAVTIALPLTGYNYGNPYLNKITNVTGYTDETAKGKWCSAAYNDWAKALNGTDTAVNLGYILLYPLKPGTYYWRHPSRNYPTSVPTSDFCVFSNPDIMSNPTAKLDSSVLSVALTNTFDWEDYEGVEHSGQVTLGEWEYLDGSGTTYGECFVVMVKIVVPEGNYAFIKKASVPGADYSPGISENYDINSLYTIFKEDPSGNILQIAQHEEV